MLVNIKWQLQSRLLFLISIWGRRKESLLDSESVCMAQQNNPLQSVWSSALSAMMVECEWFIYCCCIIILLEQCFCNTTAMLYPALDPKSFNVGSLILNADVGVGTCTFPSGLSLTVTQNAMVFQLGRNRTQQCEAQLSQKSALASSLRLSEHMLPRMHNQGHHADHTIVVIPLFPSSSPFQQSLPVIVDRFHSSNKATSSCLFGSKWLK